VLERVLEVGEEPRLVEELRSLEMCQGPVQLVVAAVGDGAQEWERQVLADRGCRLQERPLRRRQPVDPRRQDRLDRGRNRDGGHRPGEPVCPALAGEDAGLHQRAEALL
jgi:hypothetical protein